MDVNKELWRSQSVPCLCCKRLITKGNWSTHLKSKKHQTFSQTDSLTVSDNSALPPELCPSNLNQPQSDSDVQRSR